MKKSLKSAALLTLALLMLVTGVYVPFRTAEAAMMYNNANTAYIESSVNANGVLTVYLTVDGKKGITTCIEVKLYIEKRVAGLFWNRIDIGYPNNTWIDATTSCNYANTFSTQVPSTGTYRATAVFTVYGTGGSADTITKTSTCSY